MRTSVAIVFVVSVLVGIVVFALTVVAYEPTVEQRETFRRRGQGDFVVSRDDFTNRVRRTWADNRLHQAFHDAQRVSEKDPEFLDAWHMRALLATELAERSRLAHQLDDATQFQRDAETSWARLASMRQAEDPDRRDQGSGRMARYGLYLDGWIAWGQGDRVTARERWTTLLDRVRRDDSVSPARAYRDAQIASLSGEIDLAIESFERAVRTGYQRLDWVAVDPDLEALRADPRFDPILQRARQNLEKRRVEGS